MRKFAKKNAKLVAAVTLAASLIAAPSAFALNYGGGGSGTGNKPVSFVGYEVVDSTHVALFFDKKSGTSGQVDRNQFKLTANGGTTDLISSITVTSGTGTSGSLTDTLDAGIQNGTKVVLNLSSSLTDHNLYDVTIRDTVMDDNGFTVGNYQKRKDITFTFQDPDGSGAYDYTYAPIVTYVVGDGATNVSYESNMTVIFERPLKASELSTFKTNLDNNFLNTTPNPDVKASSNSECYTPVSNDANSKSNTFYFPMTKQSSSSTVYNRAHPGSNSYSLTPPTFTDLNGTTWTSTDLGGAYTFSTASNDYPGWLNNTISSATGGTGTITLTFTGTTITPAPDGYYLYYTASTNGQYASDDLWTLKSGEAHAAGANVVFGDNGTSIPAGTYYIRLVPENTIGTVGPCKAYTSTITVS